MSKYLKFLDVYLVLGGLPRCRRSGLSRRMGPGIRLRQRYILCGKLIMMWATTLASKPNFGTILTAWVIEYLPVCSVVYDIILSLVIKLQWNVSLAWYHTTMGPYIKWHANETSGLSLHYSNFQHERTLLRTFLWNWAFLRRGFLWSPRLNQRQQGTAPYWSRRRRRSPAIPQTSVRT